MRRRSFQRRVSRLRRQRTGGWAKAPGAREAREEERSDRALRKLRWERAERATPARRSCEGASSFRWSASAGWSRGGRGAYRNPHSRPPVVGEGASRRYGGCAVGSGGSA